MSVTLTGFFMSRDDTHHISIELTPEQMREIERQQREQEERMVFVEQALEAIDPRLLHDKR